MADSVLVRSLEPRFAWSSLAGAKSALAASLFGVQSTAISVSLLAHLGLATIAVYHIRSLGNPNTSAKPESYLEMPAPDLLPPSINPVEPALNTVRASGVHRSATNDASHREATARATPTVPSVEPAAPTDLLAGSAASAPRFVMAAIPTTRLSSGVVANSGHRVLGGDAGNAPISDGIADVPAKLRAGAPPAYTAAAQAAGVEADVPLKIVVDPSGSVLSAEGLSHVGYGLDEAALNAVRGYRFTPARRAGKAVAVYMRWLMRFQLR